MAETDKAATFDSLRGKRVVICEVEAITIMHLARAFERAGLNVVGSASDRPEALKVIKHERPDIITMDVHMPVLNGVETIRRVLHDHDACIVVISAYSDQETKESAMEAGACAYISKPIDGQNVVRTVEGAYREYQAKRTNAAPAPAG